MDSQDFDSLVPPAPDSAPTATLAPAPTPAPTAAPAPDAATDQAEQLPEVAPEAEPVADVHVIEHRSFAREDANAPMVVTRITTGA